MDLLKITLMRLQVVPVGKLELRKFVGIFCNLLKIKSKTSLNNRELS